MKRHSEKLTLQRLRELLEYEETTGEFYWKIAPCNSVKAGELAGRDKDGYLVIFVRGKGYYAHRLAWFYVHGEWPANTIDHINGIKNDNRIANLRSVSRVCNSQNLRKPTARNTTGFLCVSHISANGKYRASIRVNKKQVFLGEFDTPEAAHAVYLENKRRLHEGCTI